MKRRRLLQGHILVLGALALVTALPGCSEDDPSSPSDESTAITFARSYGDGTRSTGTAIRPTSDGGYIITGRTGSSDLYDGDLLLLKLDADGDSVWAQTYGSDVPERGYSVQQLTDGGFVVAGTKGDSGTEYARCWLLRTDAQGDTLWTRTFAASGNAEGRTVVVTPDGGFRVAGTTEDYRGGPTLTWLLQTDDQGVEVWSKIYGAPHYQFIWSAILLRDGGTALVGTTEEVDNRGDVMLLRTDADGDSLWSRRYGGDIADYGTNVTETDDGGFLVSAITRSFGGSDMDAWLIRTDGEGSELWNRVHGGDEDDAATAVRTNSDGSYIVAGFRNKSDVNVEDFWLFRTDEAGEIVWSHEFGGDDDEFVSDVEHTSDGGFVLVGSTESFGTAYADVWVVKTDANGEVEDPEE